MRAARIHQPCRCSSLIFVRRTSISIGNGQPRGAKEFRLAAISADRFAISSLLRSQTKSKDLVGGRLSHSHIVSRGLDHETVLANCVIQMYGSCGVVIDARSVFDGLRDANLYSCNIMIHVYCKSGPLDAARELFNCMPARDFVTWNAMIAACVHHGNHEEGLDLLWSMQHDGISFNAVAFLSALDACIGSSNIAEGRKIHITIVCVGLDHTLILSNSLINFYGKHELVEDAHSVFSRMSHRDVVSWTAMLSAFVKAKNGLEALHTFQMMQSKGIEADKIAHICAIDACSINGEIEYGQLIHATLVEDWSEADMFASTALINFYGECGNVHDARNVFIRMPVRNIVSWTAMLAALSQNKISGEALHLFEKMQIEGICPNTVTYVFALNACSGLPSLTDGQSIHMLVVILGIESDAAISVCLVNLYGKYGLMHEAKGVFSKIHCKNVVAWSALITSCTQNGCAKEALRLFHQMQEDGLKPNNITFLCVVDACTSLEALNEGRAVDECICKCGFGKDVILCNALMNMYRKCGDLQNSRIVFDRMHSHNLVSWTALIAAFAQMGCGQQAVLHFQNMLSSGIYPDNIAFTCILSACSHAGLVDGSMCLFSGMLKDSGVLYTIDHFVCMIDLVGRVGHLSEAEALLGQAPFQHLSSAWLSLLGACQGCGDVQRGLLAALSYTELHPWSSTPYTILGNVVTLEDNEVSVSPLRDLFFEEMTCKNEDWVITQAMGVA